MGAYIYGGWGEHETLIVVCSHRRIAGHLFSLLPRLSAQQLNEGAPIIFFRVWRRCFFLFCHFYQQ